MSEKQEKITVNTPIGEVQWFKMVTPDQKYNKYTMDLIVDDGPEIQSLLAQISELEEACLAESIAKAKPQNKKKVKLSGNACIEPQYDDQGEETGKFVIKLRQNATYKCSKTDEIKSLHPPKLFDAKAKEIVGEAKQQLMVFNGSEARAQLTLSPYFVPSIGVGVSARPNAVQIIKLAEGSGGSNPDFGEVEGGFEQTFGNVEDSSGDAGDF